MADDFDNMSITSESDSSSMDEPVLPVKKTQKKANVAINNIDEEDDISDAESEINASDVSENDSDYEELDVPTGYDDNFEFNGDKYDNSNFPEIEMDEEDEEEDEEDYFKKLNEEMQQDILQNHHPELIINNYEEIDALCTIVRDGEGVIVDPLHKTLPYVTRYEKARILGERAKQLNAGAPAFIEIDDPIMDGYLIALREFESKKIPFIVQRPLPNGGCEYWRLSDLEILQQ